MNAICHHYRNGEKQIDPQKSRRKEYLNPVSIVQDVTNESEGQLLFYRK